MPDAAFYVRRRLFAKKEFSFSFHLRGKSKTVFISVFFCLLCILSLLSGTALSIRQQEKENTYMEKVGTVCERMTELADSTLNAAMNACNTVFSQSWYTHFRNNADLYEDTFTVMYRAEVSTALSGLVLSHPFLKDIAVITPYKDSVISSHGWYNLKDYQRFFRLAVIEPQTDFTKYPNVSAVQSSQCVISLQDFNNRYYKSLLAMVIDKNNLSRQFAGILQENISCFSLYYGDIQLMTLGKPQQDDIAYSWKSGESPITAYISYCPFAVSEDNTLVRDAIVCVLLIIAVSLLLALFFTWLSIVPLKNILHDITGSKKEDPYEAIYQHLMEKETRYDQLSTENDTLQAALGEASAALEELRSQRNHEDLTKLLADFLNAFRSGNQEACLSILENARYEKNCKPELFLLLVSSPVRKFSDFRDMTNEEMWEETSECVMDECVRSITEENEETVEEQTELGENVCRFIRENFNNPDMSVNLLADEFHVSRTLISRVCKTASGQTFTDYLLSLRVAHAEMLLRDTEMNLAQISSSVGYDNYRSFKRAYSRCKGISPAEYRQQEQQMEEANKA